MSQLPDLSNVKIKGPFWSANAQVIQFADPRENWAFRNLFVDNTPRSALGTQNLFLPGTLLALCFVQQVQVQPVKNSQLTYTWQRQAADNRPANPSLSQIKERLYSGQWVLLLLQADPNPEQWRRQNKDALPEFTCLAGDINLDVLTAQQDAKQRLYRALKLEQLSDNPSQRKGAARLLGAVSVHSSGLSIYGKASLPWKQEPISACFQLARILPDRNEQLRFRLTIEVERLIDGEKDALIEAWQNLSVSLNPKNPLNGRSLSTTPTPTWVTLELANPRSIPRLYWQISSWQEAPDSLPLHFEPDEINLLLSDRQPYDTQNPPTSLARIVPNTIGINRQENKLRIALEVGSASIASQETLTYEASLSQSQKTWEEAFKLANLEVAFSPVQTPQLLRNHQNLPIPEWFSAQLLFTIESVEQADLDNLDNSSISEKIRQKFADNNLKLPQPVWVEIKQKGTDWLITTEDKQPLYTLTKEAKKLNVFEATPPNPVEPAVVWGFMPLENGWAQLPIPNLSEQIYLDAELARSQTPQSQTSGVLRQGAVSYGNDRIEVLNAHRQEQPWNLTLTDAQYLSGVWELEPNPAKVGEFRLTKIKVDALAPEVILNGFFWLSTEKPTAADALPNLDNWISSLQSVPLKTVKPERDLFPAVVTTLINQLAFSVRQSSNDLSAQLKAWSFAYQANKAVFRNMVRKGVLPVNAFSHYLPLVWRRHDKLPMIQALPLTQSQSPPNYASPNRQLAPFELGTIADVEDQTIKLPGDWRFGVTSDNGAATWPRLLSKTQAAQEWQSLFDLPLTALSIPGLVLDPKPEVAGLELDAATQLPIQYRFDLPYTDELNALAQLPKVPRNPNEVSPLPDSPPPEPPKPLTRETFAEHWQRLAERANLASVDAAAALIKQGNQTLIRHLIEPFNWSVNLKFSPDYPGKLTLENSNSTQPATLELSEESALKGISGKFTVENGQLSRLAKDSSPTSQPYQIEAGSMAAYRESNGAFRDQRGLLRSASIKRSQLVKTPVKLHEIEVFPI